MKSLTEMAQAGVADFQSGFGDIESAGPEQFGSSFHPKLAHVLWNRSACGGRKGSAQIKRTAPSRLAYFFQTGWIRYSLPQQSDHFFDPFNRKPLLSMAKEFLIILRDKKQFRCQFHRLRLIPDRLGHCQHRRLAQAGEQLQLTSRQSCGRCNRRLLGLTRYHVADQGMEGGDEFPQMSPQKIKGHFDRQKL